MEKNNIFEGAKFPDIFILRCGLPAVFVHKTEDSVEFIYQPRGTIYSGLTVYPNGRYSYYGKESELDVVGKYHEEIDEVKLDELASSFNYHNQDDRYDDSEIGAYYGFQEGFKVGYRKAKED